MTAVALFLLLSTCFAQNDVQLSWASGSLRASKSYNTKCFEINKNIDIGFYYKYKDQNKTIYVTGENLLYSKIISDSQNDQKLLLVFQPDPNFELKVNLSLRKNIPAVYVESNLQNISDSAQNNIEGEWFVLHKFDSYNAMDGRVYKMPDKTGVDYTAGKITKGDWATIGTGREEKWIYLLSQSYNIGILFGGKTSFGIRQDGFTYWGEFLQGFEEQDIMSCKFVIFTGQEINEFKNFLSKEGN